MNEQKVNSGEQIQLAPYLLFLIARVFLLLSLPLSGVRSYGDHWNFYQLASSGWPFVDLWVEFPPLFPFLSRIVYLLVGGREQAYIYTTALIFSVFQTGSIYLFERIAARIWGGKAARRQIYLYAFLLVGLFYGWAYFDSLGVFFMLAAILAGLEKKDDHVGLMAGLGGLVKWFPVLVVPAYIRWRGWRKSIRSILVSIVILLLVWSLLFAVSPGLTKASFLSQGAKGSWETIWALVDGNLGTGNFGAEVDHFNPGSALIAGGNPPWIPPYLTLVLFGGLGLALFLLAKVDTPRKFAAFTGLTLTIFLLWSPGYSPQWVLYLLPLILLSFSGLRGILLSLVVVSLNLLEWPILLSRGLFQYLSLLIIFRAALYLGIAFLFGQIVFLKTTAVRSHDE